MVSIPVFQTGGVSSILVSRTSLKLNIHKYYCKGSYRKFYLLIYNVEYEPEPCLFLKYKIIIKMQTLQFTYFSHECMEATAMQSWGIQKGYVYD